VPICMIANDQSCTGAVQGEVFPAWSVGWRYFRAHVEGAFLRFFWSPDKNTWRVQDKTGVQMELGVPLNDANYTDAVEHDPQDPTHIFRWNLVREYDTQGDVQGSTPAPNNVVVYRYKQQAAIAYVTDIYDTPPASNPVTAPLSSYAHHTVLRYEPRSDAPTSFRRGYPSTMQGRLQGIDVLSMPMSAQNTPRELVRRYHLTYDSKFHASLLTSVQMEGRCGQPIQEPLQLPTNCPTLPAMRFSYQHVDPFDTKGNPSFVDLAGYEGFDERIINMTASPATSVDDLLTDLFDVDANGLPDVLVTDPGSCNGKHCVYFNGKGGLPDRFTKDFIGVISPIGDTAGTLGYKNPNVAPLDVDGDGIADLLHMPQVKTYAVYTPTFANNAWNWLGRDITTASQQSPKINFTTDGTNIRVVDVDGDGLVDVLRSTGTEWQTYFSLGRYPSGDSQYGHAIRTSATTATISNDPISKCVPYSGTPVQLSDPDIKLGDMNGDGLVDIVRIRIGDMRYWPGRGNGIFGTGGDCVANSYGSGRDIAMQSSPQYSNIQGETLRLDDINGDGLDDLVQVRQNDVDVWLNVDGSSWTNKHTIAGTPPSPSFANKVRLVDANGSGTRDILWGAGGKYQYIDLAGAKRPSVLIGVENGLGKTTELEYSTSTALMLAAENANNPWASVLPMPVHVVTKVTEKDNLGLVGRPDGVYVTAYNYRDPVYDGRQREFRGFRFAAVTRVGDSNSPTAVTESTFILGECVPENNVDSCSFAERWRDNPREALKGLPVLSETHDLNGVYQSSVHHTYRLRRLYVGLDGREVRHAFEDQSDRYLYDDAPFQGGNQSAALPETEIELALQQVAVDSSRTISVRSSTRAHLRSLVGVDYFGNRTQTTAEGCIDGCAQQDESILTVTTPGRRNDDPSGWMWRTVDAYVNGSQNPNTKRNHLSTAYDIRGNPVAVNAELAGTLALDRFHESNKAIAPSPPNASQDGTIGVSMTSYDAFGSVTDQQAPNGRCRSIAYDSDYSQLAMSETVFVGDAGQNGCGKTPLIAKATYDRGLMLVTAAADLHGEVTAVIYDGFGRLVQLFRPDPDSIGPVSKYPSLVLAASRLDVSSAHEIGREQGLAACARERRFAEISRRVDGLELRRFEQRVEGRRDLRAAFRFRAKMISAPDDRTSDASLGAVVVERDARIVHEAREPLPVCYRVRRCVSDRERLERRLRPEPRLELLEDIDGLRPT